MDHILFHFLNASPEGYLEVNRGSSHLSQHLDIFNQNYMLPLFEFTKSPILTASAINNQLHQGTVATKSTTPNRPQLTKPPSWISVLACNAPHSVSHIWMKRKSEANLFQRKI
jgi:hypothetical protein